MLVKLPAAVEGEVVDAGVGFENPKPPKPSTAALGVLLNGPSFSAFPSDVLFPSSRVVLVAVWLGLVGEEAVSASEKVNRDGTAGEALVEEEERPVVGFVVAEEVEVPLLPKTPPSFSPSALEAAFKGASVVWWVEKENTAVEEAPPGVVGDPPPVVKAAEEAPNENIGADVADDASSARFLEGFSKVNGVSFVWLLVEKKPPAFGAEPSTVGRLSLLPLLPHPLLPQLLVSGAALFCSVVSFRGAVNGALSFVADKGGAPFSSLAFGVVPGMSNETVGVGFPEEKEKATVGLLFCDASPSIEGRLVDMEEVSEAPLDAGGVHEVFPGENENGLPSFWINMEVTGALERVAVVLLPLFIPCALEPSVEEREGTSGIENENEGLDPVEAGMEAAEALAAPKAMGPFSFSVLAEALAFAPSEEGTPKENFGTDVSDEGAVLETGRSTFFSELGGVSVPFRPPSLPVREKKCSAEVFPPAEGDAEEEEDDDDEKGGMRAALPPSLPLKDSIKCR